MSTQNNTNQNKSSSFTVKTDQNLTRIVKVSGLNKAKDKKAPGAFRTISEVAKELDVAQHVLRFWETKFTQIKPLKRGGGRRYYRPEDVALLKHIHYLLYGEGYTIKGVQKLFKGQTKNQIVSALVDLGSIEAAPKKTKPYAETVANYSDQTSSQKPAALTNKQRSILEAMLGELKEMRSIVKK